MTGAFDRTLLYLAAFATGAVIMMIEVLGTRIGGPFYGVSLFVWSSLISGALIALALGYCLGGIVADRFSYFQMSYGIETDSIEIDPEVARAAQDYFGFEGASSLIVGDARYEIRGLRKQYSFIIHDCFSCGVVPSTCSASRCSRTCGSF